MLTTGFITFSLLVCISMGAMLLIQMYLDNENIKRHKEYQKVYENYLQDNQKSRTTLINYYKKLNKLLIDVEEKSTKLNNFILKSKKEIASLNNYTLNQLNALHICIDALTKFYASNYSLNTNKSPDNIKVVLYKESTDEDIKQYGVSKTIIIKDT